MAFSIELRAVLFWRHVRGATPFVKNTRHAEKFTHTTLIINNRAAPKAKSNCPALSSKPHVTAGGIRATATITPTRTLDKPVVSDSTAVYPHKNKTRSSLVVRLLKE